MNLRHPFSRAVYESQESGLVRVEEESGRAGLFHPDGRWHYFEPWPLENRYKEAHVAKVLPCNWKVAQGSLKTGAVARSCR